MHSNLNQGSIVDQGFVLLLYILNVLLLPLYLATWSQYSSQQEELMDEYSLALDEVSQFPVEVRMLLWAFVQ